MENATKALVIAGTILITVMILGVLAYLFNHYSNYAYEQNQRQIEQQLEQFNAKFEKYKEKELTLQDVITIANMAHEYNLKHDASSYGHIEVFLKSGGSTFAADMETLNIIDSFSGINTGIRIDNNIPGEDNLKDELDATESNKKIRYCICNMERNDSNTVSKIYIAKYKQYIYIYIKK